MTNNINNKNNIKGLVVKVLIRMLAAALLGFVIYASVNFVFRSIGNPEVGYKVYTAVEDGTYKFEYEYRWASGEEKIIPELEKNQQSFKIYPHSSTTEIVAQFLLGALLIILIYSVVWETADKDRNRISNGQICNDKYRGQKVGLITSIPAALSYLFLVICKIGILPPQYFPIYKLVNYSFSPYINLITNYSVKISDITWIQIALLLPAVFVVFCVVIVAYHLGFKQIILTEKILYKKEV